MKNNHKLKKFLQIVDNCSWKIICKFMNSKPLLLFSYVLMFSIFGKALLYNSHNFFLYNNFNNLEHITITLLVVGTFLHLYNEIICKKFLDFDMKEIFQSKKNKAIKESSFSMLKNELLFTKEANEQELNK